VTRVLICGDRNGGFNEPIAKLILDELLPGDVIIQGMCRGVDRTARYLGLKYGFRVEDYPADWNKYGKAAGPIRNKQKLDEGKPDIVYAFHPDLSKSKGAKNMVEQARKRGIKVIVVNEL